MTAVTSPDMRHFMCLPMNTPGFDVLTELALDLHWSWNHATDDIWRQIDARLWESTHNPWVVLQTASRQHIEQLLGDDAFRSKVDSLRQDRRDAVEAPAWFQNTHPQSPLSCVAYFSMEFMLSEALPIYSGGLGNVAGDHLKTASDLGVPVIGIGLLYSQGYFRQVIDKEGAQQALFPYNDPGQLPITPLRRQNGEWLRLEVTLPGHSVWLRAWEVQVGRSKLYLLDSNDPANRPVYRGITSELYGGGPELRLAQELVLGIGGWRLLAALDIHPEVCHLNEGHAAFAVLERARSVMQESAQPFAVALTASRAGNLFTTHTAVSAGFDRFAPELIERYLGGYAQQELGISVADLLALGRADPRDASEPFNMAYLAVRGSGAVNGVSQLHGAVSRRLFAPLFPRWPQEEVPIGHVTNGVHMPTWDSVQADELWTRNCGKARWLEPTETLAADVRQVTDATLWQLRNSARMALVEYARQRLATQLTASGTTPDEVVRVSSLFDPGALTLGFARRFATYKRPNLLLHDQQRLQRILTSPGRPVQLILAGKAHPDDRAGQALIQEWVQFARQPALRAHVIFLGDYDMQLAQQLVQGVDVWINTPRRPWEACGTSGMKVLVNGGLNLSELDGWWAEAYTPQVGWALGDQQEHGDDPAWDIVEADRLYSLLEDEVIPEFYDRDSGGIPRAWVGRVRESLAQLTPHFSSNRSVREYTGQHYLAAAAAYRTRSADRCAVSNDIVERQRILVQQWGDLRFGGLRVETDGDRSRVEVDVYLPGIDPDLVRVELYADPIQDPGAARPEMTVLDARKNAPGWLVFGTTVSAARPPGDYTARLTPRRSGVALPLEIPLILWQR